MNNLISSFDKLLCTIWWQMTHCSSQLIWKPRPEVERSQLERELNETIQFGQYQHSSLFLSFPLKNGIFSTFPSFGWFSTDLSFPFNHSSTFDNYWFLLSFVVVGFVLSFYLYLHSFSHPVWPHFLQETTFFFTLLPFSIHFCSLFSNFLQETMDLSVNFSSLFSLLVSLLFSSARWTTVTKRANFSNL